MAFGLPAAALLVGPLVAALGGRLLKTSWTSNFALWAVVSVGVAAAAFSAWPALGRVLLAYAYAARIPVVLVMAVAIWKGAGTHYDLPPPGFPALPPLRRWLWIGRPAPDDDLGGLDDGHGRDRRRPRLGRGLPPAALTPPRRGPGRRL